MNDRERSLGLGLACPTIWFFPEVNQKEINSLEPGKLLAETCSIR
jgi:hypothetical protein